jgi:phenylpyruvate tautomerase PptA (4-oxalocrotonate tautomerase family)
MAVPRFWFRLVRVRRLTMFKDRKDAGTQLAERMSAFIVDALDKDGKKVQITFEDPDTFIIVETAGNRAGVGLITRAMRERYPFIRAK